MDEDIQSFDSFDDAVEAFMKAQPEFIEDDESAEEVTEDTGEEVEVDEEDSASDDRTDDEDGDTDDEEPPVASDVSDDAEVTVKVNGEEKKVKIADLKRLAGQEAALTQRSQTVAAQHRALEQQNHLVANILETRWNQAKAKAEKYANVDLIQASHRLDSDEYEALREAKENAEQEFYAIDREARDFLTKANETRQVYLKAQGREALKTITKMIPEWNDQVYASVRSYAVSQGMDVETVNETIDPAIITMMYKAMKMDQAKTKVEGVKKKVIKAPTRATSKSSAPVDPRSNQMKKLQAKARSGSVDDVADLFLASMSS